MTVLSDIFPAGMLDEALRERTVVARRHPSRDLTILNYSDRCQYEPGLWNAVTRQCRGLIHDDFGNVLARPFRKFFNHGQKEAETLDLAAPCIVTDKLDGSLGILYRRDVSYAIATRGSFDSEQAQHATALWYERYDTVPVPVGWTLLFEIIYPENRIVCDYGERDDLILLGAVNIETGRSIDPHNPLLTNWPGPRAEMFYCKTVAEALALPPRPNAEGVVIHMIVSDERVKVKQEDYVALHRIVTGLNERTVWEHLVAGKPVRELLGALPDEFHGWVGEVAARLVATVERGRREVETAYSAILAALPPEHTRKDFALIAKEHPHRAQLFARLSGKDYDRQLWDECYPSPRVGPRGLVPTEATA
jgi:RNA ligase